MNLGILDRFVSRIATNRAFILPKNINGNLALTNIHYIDGQTYFHLPVREATVIDGRMSMFAETRKNHAIVEFVKVVDFKSHVVALYRLLEHVSGEFSEGNRVWLSGWLNPVSNLDDLNAELVQFRIGSKGLLAEANTDVWVIHVHGWNASVDETTRTFGALHRAGFNSLSVAWTTDFEPWGNAQRVCNYGATEFMAIIDAVEFARQRGAGRIHLFGYSMGTTLIANYLALVKSDSIDSVVLDSPLVDLRYTLSASMRRLNVSAKRITLSLAYGQKRLRSMGSSFEQLSYAKLKNPPRTLIFYAAKDEFLDMSPVVEMCSANQVRIQSIALDNAGHCRTFNQNPADYEVALINFLRATQKQ